MIRRILSLLPLLLATLVCAQTTSSSVTIPRLIRYTGTLGTDSTVKPGVTGVTFALYKDQEGGSPLWLETQNVNVDSTGHYSVLLGSASRDGLPADLFTGNEARWLGVQASGQTEQPRVLLVSVPYALKAGDAETLNGLPASAFLQAASATSAAASGTSVVTEAVGVPSPRSVSSSTGTTNQLAKWTDSTDLGNSIIFDNGTDVGIGTTSPQSTLDVNGQSIFRSPQTQFLTTTTFGPQFVFTNAATPTAAKWAFGVPGYANATAFFIYDSVTGNAPFTMERGAGANALYFKNGGNIGLGTSTPSNKLTVTGIIQSTTGGFMFPDATMQTTAAKGTISGVTAGTGLTGGGTTGAVTLNVDTTKVVTGILAGTGLTGGGTGGSINLALDQTFTDSRYLRLTGGVLSGSLMAPSFASTSGGYVFPDGSTLTSAVAPAVTTAVTYNGTTSNEILYGIQNQAGVTTGFNASGVPTAVRGDSTTSSGYAAGVFGSASSPLAPGVAGVNVSTCPASGTCDAYGVFGWSVNATNGTGIWGEADSSTSSTNVGVYGTSAGDGGTGVEGYANNSSSGDGTGVYGLTIAPNGTGVWGNSTITTGSTIGVYGSVAATTGVAGQFDAPTNGTILVGRSGTTSFSKVFRVDSTGKGFFDGGTQTGGADFAESVDALGGAARYQPGDVMMIDSTGSRRLALSNRAYSTKVAGIYSTKPGVLATPHEMDDTRLADEVPLAIVGIVPCKVSAENGPIQAGDLLVTASRPGYAMKGTDRRRMLGAVVGKALGSLDKGTGTIEVLVSLH